jgi:hypothetical protein
MKVYAQSVVPVHPPYLHVGYLAATAADQYGFPLVLISLMVAAAGGFLLAKCRRVRERVSAFGLTLKPSERRQAFVAGIALVSLGVLGFASLPFLSKVPLHASRVTRFQIQRVEWALAEGFTAGKPLPKDMQELRGGYDIDDAVIRDAWGHEFRVVQTSYEGEVVCIIASAGPDGIFDTPDDIRNAPEDFVFFLHEEAERAGAAPSNQGDTAVPATPP